MPGPAPTYRPTAPRAQDERAKLERVMHFSWGLECQLSPWYTPFWASGALGPAAPGTPGHAALRSGPLTRLRHPDPLSVHGEVHNTL